MSVFAVLSFKKWLKLFAPRCKECYLSFFLFYGYGSLMKRKYGDYMILPPEEKRVSNHSLHSFYWN